MSDTEKILKAFKTAGKPLKNAEIVEISGVDKTEVSKILKSLLEEGEIHSPKRCFYDLSLTSK